MQYNNESQIPLEKFEIVGTQQQQAERLDKKTLSFWSEVFRRFLQNKLAVVGAIIVMLITLFAIFGPYLVSFSYSEQTGIYNQAPSATHWFGTDDLGRDIFVRIWYGARISIAIGLIAAFLDVVIGVVYGATAGLRGGKTDNIMMRFADILSAVPYLLVVILLLVVLKQGLIPMVLALTITGWINMARIVRGEVLTIKNNEYVLASRTLGANTWHILIKHIIPNAMGAIIVTMTLTVPSAIFTESFLSYLGLGIQQPFPSWGTMASEGVAAYQYYPWRLFFPASFICLTIFGFNAVGDGLRDALDPKLRK